MSRGGSEMRMRGDDDGGNNHDSQQWIPKVRLNYTKGQNNGDSLLKCYIEPIGKYSKIKNSWINHPPMKRPSTNDIMEQEMMIMDDLLYVLIGCEGSYIRFSEFYDANLESDRLRGPDFKIAKFFDPSIKDLAMGIVECAKWYMGIRAFCEYQSRDIYGRVNQALCASIRDILKDYLLVIGQLEYEVMGNGRDNHGNDPHVDENIYQSTIFSLHQMSIHLVKISNVLHQVYGVCQTILEENIKKAEEAARVGGSNDIEEIIEKIRGGGVSSRNGGADGSGRPISSFATGTSKTSIFNTNISLQNSICRGGSILKLLAQRLQIYSGDPTCSSILKKLLNDSSKPYLDMFNKWIYKGIIDDPCQEFLICENQSSHFNPDSLHQDYIDKYWEKRYTVRKDDLPLQLSNPEIYEKVLLAGKYLNVIRECGGGDKSDRNYSNSNTPTPTYTSIEDPKLILHLTSAYQFANHSLLNLLIETHGLKNRLTSLKHYFFLDRADFFINFLDIASSELIKPSKQASITKLQYLLDMALRQPGSISYEDPFKDEVIVSMSHKSLTEYLLQITNIIGVDADQVRKTSTNSSDYVRNMVLAAKRADVANPTSSADLDKKAKSFTAIMGLQLDFQMPFPLSLALSRNSIMRYQFLFRHLVELKNIERTLNHSWLEQMKSKVWRNNSYNSPLTSRVNNWKRNAIRLRSRMLVFIQQLLYFCTIDVIETNWTKLKNELTNSKTVDLLMKQHIAYLDTIIKECMLTSPMLLKIRAKLFRVCQMYGNYLPNQTSSLVQIDPKCVPSSERHLYGIAVNKEGEEYPAEVLVNYLENSLSQYQASFDNNTRAFVEEINHSGASYSSILLTLSARLEACM